MTPMHFWILYFHTYDTQLSKCENLNSFFSFLNSAVVTDLFDYSKHVTELCIGSNSSCAKNIWRNIFFLKFLSNSGYRKPLKAYERLVMTY
jgi:hypothetical protein